MEDRMIDENTDTTGVGGGEGARLRLRVAVHQGNEIDGYVVPGAQPVARNPPASVLQHAPCSHDQVLGGHGVPDLKTEEEKR